MCEARFSQKPQRAPVNDANPIRDLLGERQGMGRHKDRHSALGQFAQPILDDARVLRIEA